MAMPKKAKADRIVRVNVSLPPVLFQAGKDLVRIDLYASFAEMVQCLIRERYRVVKAQPPNP